MKDFLFRMTKMTFGLILFSFGVVMTVKANIGYAPWEVFHVGISINTGLSLGVVAIITGLVIVVLVTIIGEKFGIGTIACAVLTGVFIDLILMIDVIPQAVNFPIGLLMLVIGMFILAIGTYFYIGSALGTGPRDSLMVALTRKTKLPIGLCRGILELTVTVIGWLLGGMVGVGTIISVIGIGTCIQITFKALRFDATAVKHENLAETYALLTGKGKK
ncbi:MAG: hypothetical protein FWG32_03710 [Oscillospiraceae bacterium]|nr:hypothetical protein [Oscillospiraceae bacterium]